MRIGIIGSNSVECAELLLNIWNNDDSAVLIDSSAPPSIVFSMLSDAGVSDCYVERSLAYDYVDAPPPLTIRKYSIETKMPCILPESVRSMFRPRYDETEALVIFSSGTSGKCKGISLSHRAINNNADSIINYMKPSENDCLYLNKKLTHCSSLIGELLVALKSGADVIVSPLAIPPRVAFKNISDFNVSILCCNPTLLKMYVDEVERTNFFPESVRVVYTSGEIISAKDIERARMVLKRPVHNVYGQTECGPRITAQTETCCAGDSVGKPIKNVKIKIDDNGEILVKTNALFSGYTDGIKPNPQEWHRTGDVGYTDQNGELYVTGRIDNMIVVGAHNVYPESVEKVIIENANVDDCIVFMEDGKLVCEFVGQSKTPLTIIRSIKSLLMPYEVPKVFRKIDAILRNGNDKKPRNKNMEA